MRRQLNLSYCWRWCYKRTTTPLIFWAIPSNRKFCWFWSFHGLQNLLSQPNFRSSSVKLFLFWKKSSHLYPNKWTYRLKFSSANQSNVILTLNHNHPTADNMNIFVSRPKDIFYSQNGRNTKKWKVFKVISNCSLRHFRQFQKVLENMFTLSLSKLSLFVHHANLLNYENDPHMTSFDPISASRVHTYTQISVGFKLKSEVNKFWWFFKRSMLLEI